MITDFDKLVKLAYPGQPSIFTQKQLEDINEIIKFHDYYDGESFKYVVTDFPEYGRNHNRDDYRPAQLVINYIRKIIDKLTSFQFEIPVDISATVEGKPGDGMREKAEDIEQYLYGWHKKNKLNLKHLQAAKEHNISGGVAYKLMPDDGLGEARAVIRERIECFPVTDFDDYENISKVHFVAFVNEKEIWKQTFEMAGGSCHIEEAIYSAGDIKQVTKEIVPYQPLKVNGQPLDFMPVYIIPNLPMLGEVWGLSEVKDLTGLQDEINKKYSDLSDSLRFEMFAITILLNITDVADNDSLKTKPGAVWHLMGGGDNKIGAEKLESKFPYIESLRYHLESMKSLMFELSDCIQLEGKQIENVGQLSGVALRMLFANMISKINQKNTIWTEALERIYTDAVKIKSYYDRSFKLPEDLDITIIPHVPIPLNKKEEVEIITQKLAFNLTSVKAAMDELGVQNPELMIAEILNEQKTFEQALSQYADTRETKTSE